ncbi:MAG TPA: metal-dependent hydrolase [Candidatus Acidoferrum sp.]|nr:metal-dependent hydrolase [Candidatus Acidoferrum sp.]
MASPVGHVVVGMGLAGAAAGALGMESRLALWAGAAVASCLPDLDLIPWIWGVPFRRTHRKASHSILVLVPLVALAWLVNRALGSSLNWKLLVAWTAALLSHLLVDVLTTGPVMGRQGHGIPLFWPLTKRRWFVRAPMFPEVNLLEEMTPDLLVRTCWRELVHFVPAAVILLVLGHLF